LKKIKKNTTSIPAISNLDNGWTYTNPALLHKLKKCTICFDLYEPSKKLKKGTLIICPGCIEKLGGGLLRIEVFVKEYGIIEYHIPFKVLNYKNVLIEKYTNSLNSPMLQLGKKYNLGSTVHFVSPLPE